MRGTELVIGATLLSISIGVAVESGVSDGASSVGHSGGGPEALPPPPCDFTNYTEGDVDRAERSIKSKLIGHPIVTVKVSCTSGSHWYVTETIGSSAPIVYQEPWVFPSDNPAGVVGFFLYATGSPPAALVEMGLGTSAMTYELFVSDGKSLRPIALSGTEPDGTLVAGNAALHGEGFTCRIAGKDQVVITQTGWEASTLGSQTVRTSSQSWLLAGPMLEQVGHNLAPRSTQSIKAAMSVSHPSC